MERTFIISDTHFFHRNIINYCDRPFDNVKEMNKTLIANWNKKVSKHDRVFMLGDFALTGKDRIIETGQQLNGRKTLIMGNHDGASISTYYNAGFEFVSKFPIVFNDYFILSHMPQNIMANGIYGNIFGHIHDNPIYPTATPVSFCASVERINYTPILFEDIVAAMEKAKQPSSPDELVHPQMASEEFKVFDQRVVSELTRCFQAIEEVTNAGRNSLTITFEAEEKEVYRQVKKDLEKSGYVVIMDGDDISQQLSICWLPEHMKKPIDK